MANEPIPSPTPVTYKSVLAANAVSLAVLLWFSLRHLAAASEARGRVAGLEALPPLWFYGPELALAIVAAALVLGAWLRKRPPEHKLFRVTPVAAVVALALQAFVMPSYFLPFPADALALTQLADAEPSPYLEDDGLFTVDPARVAAAFGEVDTPFLDRDGKKQGRWRAIVQKGCAGAVTELPSGVEAGTVLYCVSADRTRAWLSAVVLQGLAGPPRLLMAGPQPAIMELERPPGSPRLAPATAPDPGGAGGPIE